MTTKDKIKYLKAAEKAFRKEPGIMLMNTKGLCLYFREICKLNDHQIKGILGKKFAKHYTFGSRYTLHDGGRSQRDIYSLKRKSFYFERADWCASEIKRLENLKS